MPTFIAELLSQAKTIWARLDGGQRLTIGAVLLATMVGMAGLVWFAQQPDYVVLRRASSIAEQNDIAQAVEKAGLEYKVSGLTVNVRSQDRQQAKLALHAAGLSGSGGEAESIISQLSSTAAGNRMRLFNKAIALAEAKIENSPMIREAVITAAEPKKQLYAEDLQHQMATVHIKLGPGRDFHTAARFALEATAASLALSRSKIKVFNANGDLFTHSEHGGGSTEGTGFLRLQDEWQFRLQGKATRILMPAFHDDVVVTVSLDLKKEATYRSGVNLPEGGLTPNLVEKDTESSETGRPVISGSPGGAAPASSSTTGAGGDRSKTANTKEKKQTDKALYGVKTVAQLAPFIERITVSVVVNETLLADITDQTARDTKVADIKAIVQNAIGFDSTRDAIEARVFKFKEPLPQAEPAGVDMIATAKEFAPAVGQVIAVLLVLMFLRSMLKKAQVNRSQAGSQVENPLDEQVEENVAPEEVARRMRREIEKAINEDPAAISRMLDNWLTEKV